MKRALLVLSLALCFIITCCKKDTSGSSGSNSTTFGVKTNTATNITEFGFTAGGVLTNYTTQNIIEVGICVSTSPNPSYDDIENTEVYPSLTGLGEDNSFTCQIGCISGTKYYYRAYVVYGSDSAPLVRQGAIRSLTTPGQSTPLRVTTYAGYIHYYYGPNGYGNYLIAGGKAEILGGSHTITQKGICYSKYNHNPDISDQRFSCGGNAGEFSAEIGTLQTMSTYYYRAYAIYDDNQVEYGATYNATSGSKTGSY